MLEDSWLIPLTNTRRPLLLFFFFLHPCCAEAAMLISPGREWQYALCHSAVISIHAITHVSLQRLWMTVIWNNRTPWLPTLWTRKGKPPLLTPLTSCTHTGRLCCQNLNAGLLNDLRERGWKQKKIVMWYLSNLIWCNMIFMALFCMCVSVYMVYMWYVCAILSQWFPWGLGSLPIQETHVPLCLQ